MGKQREVRTVKRAAPVRTALAHWGVFVTLLLAAQVQGYVVVYPKPVALVDARQQDAGWLSSVWP